MEKPRTPNVGLRARRNRAGLTVTALAAAAGVSKVTVSRIETGERYGSQETLTALAKVLGCGAVDLGGKPEVAA